MDALVNRKYLAEASFHLLFNIDYICLVPNRIQQRQRAYQVGITARIHFLWTKHLHPLQTDIRPLYFRSPRSRLYLGEYFLAPKYKTVGLNVMR